MSKLKSAIKFDKDKIRLDLLPAYPLLSIAKVLTYGARKYADRNWEKGFNYTRVYGSMQRHLLAWLSGEDKDPETGLSHLAHAGCNLVFLLEYEASGKGVDDRVKHKAKRK